MSGRKSAPQGVPQDDCAPTGCAHCRHPRALHSNGATGCMAFACAVVSCPACQGARTIGGEPCERCGGKGLLPCQEFAPVDDAADDPEGSLLAS
jgi:hypothetical protein